MKKWCGVLFVVVLLAAFASADTLKLISAPYGENGPYSMTLNGSSVKAICYSASNFVTLGESWTVQAFTIDTIASRPAGSTTYFPGTVQQYNLLGYLGSMLFASPGNADIQNAIWAVLGTGGAQNQIYQDALTYIQNNAGYKTSLLFYIPVGTFSSLTGYPYGLPQPFMVIPVPEPGTIVLTGAGFLIMMIRRQRLPA